MILGINPQPYRQSVSVYIPQKGGMDKLFFWSAGMVRKGICIAYNDNHVYLVKNSKIILDINTIGESINGDASSYELLRSIKGYYILIHHYTGRRIRPGKDDDYYSSSSYKVYNENGEQVEKWDWENVGIDRYPIELGLGLITLDNTIYELDSLEPLCIIPEKFQIDGTFTNENILKLNVTGDYKNFYVQVINGEIVSQNNEEDYERIVKELSAKQLEYLKKINPILFGNLPEVSNSIEFLDSLGCQLPYSNSIANLYLKPSISKIPWEDLINKEQIPAEIMGSLLQIYQSLFTINIHDSSKTSYVFKFAHNINCRIFNKFILFFTADSSQETILFNINGQRIFKEIYLNYGNFNHGYLPFDNKELLLFDKHMCKYVKLFIDNDIWNTKVDYTYTSSYRHDPISLGDKTIRPSCFSGEVLKNKSSIPGENLIFTEDDLKTLHGLRDFHKDAKFIFKLTYSSYAKLFKDFIIVVNKLSNDKYDDYWKLWVYNYKGELLNSKYFVINGLYFTRFLIDFSATKLIVRDQNSLSPIEIRIINHQIEIVNTEICQYAEIDNSIKYLEVSVKSKIKDYLYSLTPEILEPDEYEAGYSFYHGKGFFILSHIPGKNSIKINDIEYKIDPIKREKCLDEITYRHRNRPNFITKIKYMNKFQTNKGVINLYLFECRPYAFFDPSGKIYYNFDINKVSFTRNNN